MSNRHALAILGLWAFALLAYSNSFRAGLSLDNAWVIQEDSRIHAATSENARLILTQDYSYKNSSSGLYRPLTTFSYLVNYAILGGGSRPAGYHWVNFALHAVNILLVYWLGLLLFQEMGPAWALAAVWALHPILTESVTNIVGRADLLAGFGVLAGLLCHAKSAAASGRRKLAWLAALMLAADHRDVLEGKRRGAAGRHGDLRRDGGSAETSLGAAGTSACATAVHRGGGAGGGLLVRSLPGFCRVGRGAGSVHR